MLGGVTSVGRGNPATGESAHNFGAMSAPPRYALLSNCRARLGTVARRVCAIAHRAQPSWKHRRNEALLPKERARQIIGHSDRATKVELTVCGARSP